MSEFDEKLTKHQDAIDAAYEKVLDQQQELSDKKEKLISMLSDMVESIVETKVVEVSDLPYDPDEFVKDVRDMILYMWEDYCG